MPAASLNFALFVHLLSFSVLGVFFEIPELSLHCWCLFKASRADDRLLKKIFAARYWLTHWIAPVSGILTIATGIYLIFLERSSLTQGWLFWLLCTSTIGMYKGIIQHRFFIKGLTAVIQGGNKEGLSYFLRSPFDNICVFSECPTYLFNYWLAWKKPYLPNPLQGAVSSLEHCLNPAMAAVLIVATGSLLIPIFRFLIRKYSRLCR